MNYLKCCTLFVVVLCLFWTIDVMAESIQDCTKLSADSLYNLALTLEEKEIKEAIDYLECSRKKYIERADSIALLKTTLELGRLHRINLNFEKAYDEMWKSLSLAIHLKDSSALKEVYENLGHLYAYFNKETEAFESFNKALELAKVQYEKGNESGQDLISKFYNVAMINNRFAHYEKALQYLDTCFIYSDRLGQDKVKRAYLETEKSYVHFCLHKYSKAEELLYPAIELFESIPDSSSLHLKDKRYLVIMYSIMGDVQLWQKNYKAAKIYFEKSLMAMDKYKGHQGMRSDVLYKLSDTFAFLGDYKKAHEHLSRSKMISDSNYNAYSRNNSLLEVKNKYLEEINDKDLEIAKQNAVLFKNEREAYRFRVVVLIIGAIVIVFLLVWRIINQRKNHLMKSSEDEQLLRVKNKELTSYTLQFVENEQYITELAEYIKKSLPESKRNVELLEKAKHGRVKYWEEFNTRFLSVNQDFYKKMSEKYPVLSATELKHCALMKLNFSSKEMAQLLNISVSSVHVARHRIRKKMELDRDDSLVKVIASI